MIDQNEFWRVLDEARKSNANMAGISGWLTNYLQGQSVEDISDFEERMRELQIEAYDARLWAAAVLVMGLCSDDSFVDFRGWLTAQGQAAYESVLKNPDNLADLDLTTGDDGSPVLFDFSYAPTKAYRKKTGLDDIPIDYDKYRDPALLNENLMNMDQSGLAALFPKLHAKFGGKRS